MSNVSNYNLPKGKYVAVMNFNFNRIAKNIVRSIKKNYILSTTQLLPKFVATKLPFLNCRVIEI